MIAEDDLEYDLSEEDEWEMANDPVYEDDLDLDEEIGEAKPEEIDEETQKKDVEELRKTVSAIRKESKEKAEKARQEAAEAEKQRKRWERKVRNNEIILGKDEKGRDKKRMPEELKYFGVESKAHTRGKYKMSFGEVRDTDFTKELNDARYMNEELTQKVRAEIIDAFRSGKLCEDDEDILEANTDEFLDLLDHIPVYYAPLGDSALKASMKDYVWGMYTSVSAFLDDPKNEICEFPDPETRIFQTQKLTDILLRNYPPISNSKDALEKYARNYVIKDTDLLTRAFWALDVRDNTELYGAHLAGVGEPSLKSADPYKPGSRIFKIRNMVAMEERAQALANTPESEMTKPMREQMAIPELAEKVNERVASAKIKESESLVKENVKE